jgi:exosortase
MVPATGLVLALAALGLAFSDTWSDLVGVWRSSETYQYAVLVPPTAFYVLYLRRRQIVARPPSGSLFGVVAAAACGLVWLAADLVGAAEGRHLAVVLAALAVIWATLGTHAFGPLLPALSLLLFMVPTGHQLMPFLRDITVTMGVAGPDLLAIPTTMSGYTFSVADQSYIVIEDCAGLGELLTTLFLGAGFGLMIYTKAWKIIALTFVAGSAAIVANGLRVNAIVLANHWNGTIMEMSAHRAVGWWTIAGAIAVLFLLATRFRDVDTQIIHGWTERASPRRSVRAACFGALAAAVTIGVPHVWPVSLGVEVPAAMRSLPDRIGAWRLTHEMPDWTPQAVHADHQVRGVYTDGTHKISVFAALATSPQAEVSGPSLELLPTDTWWLPATGRRSVCSDRTCWPVQTLELDHSNGPRTQSADLLTLLNGEPQRSATTLRIKRAWDILLGQDATVGVLALATEGKEPIREREAASFFENLISEVLQTQ